MNRKDCLLKKVIANFNSINIMRNNYHKFLNNLLLGNLPPSSQLISEDEYRRIVLNNENIGISSSITYNAVKTGKVAENYNDKIIEKVFKLFAKNGDFLSNKIADYIDESKNLGGRSGISLDNFIFQKNIIAAKLVRRDFNSVEYIEAIEYIDELIGKKGN